MGKRREARALLLWLTPGSGGLGIFCPWPSQGFKAPSVLVREYPPWVAMQWVSKCGPQPSSINIIQEVIREDSSWALKLGVQPRKPGFSQALQEIDAPSGLRTTHLKRPDATLAVDTFPVAPGPPTVTTQLTNTSLEVEEPLLTLSLGWILDTYSLTFTRLWERCHYPFFPLRRIAAERA